MAKRLINIRDQNTKYTKKYLNTNLSTEKSYQFFRSIQQRIKHYVTQLTRSEKLCSGICMGRKFSKMTEAVLNAVADGIEILEYSVYKPSALMRYGYPFVKEVENERARRQMKQAAWRLKRKGYIEEKREMQSRAFRLTELGESILRCKESASFNPVAFPPNIYLIVSFDIPEQYKRARQSFRFALKNLGFHRQHLSVWISNKDWAPYLEKKLDDIKIKDWVVLMKGEIIIPKPTH